MKNLASTVRSYFFSATGAATGGGVGEPVELAGVHGTAFTALQTLIDDPVGAGHGAGLYRLRRRLSVLVDDHDELALGARLNSPLRYLDAVVGDGLRQAHADKGAG
jgi:hypothetical protein